MKHCPGAEIASAMSQTELVGYKQALCLNICIVTRKHPRDSCIPLPTYPRPTWGQFGHVDVSCMMLVGCHAGAGVNSFKAFRKAVLAMVDGV